MRIQLNGAWRELSAGVADAAAAQAGGAPTLAAMLRSCGYEGATVATAVNGEFVPARARAATALQDGDRVEVLAPMQGG
jgi:sulfur carrier protein